MKSIKEIVFLSSILLMMFSCNTDNTSKPIVPKPITPKPDSTSTLSTHKERLSYAKENLETIKNGTTALNTLITKANKELNRTPESVTEKNIVAASGDKHDYISMGPYWWPDPSKPNGLPYIRKDGQRNPEVNDYDRYKLNRFVNSVKTLSYAYFFTEDERYANKAAKFLSVWFLDEKTRMNPNLNYGQMIPGHDNSNGRAEGLIETYDFVEMIDCINLLIEAKAISAQEVTAIKQWYSKFLDWMLTSKIGLDEKASENNHGIAYDTQVVAYALFTENNGVAKSYVNQFAENRLYKQIEADGSQPLELSRTMAMHYSLYNIEHMLDMCYLANELGTSIYSSKSDDGRSIENAIRFLVQYLGKTQSEFPYQQIKDWEDNQNKLSWIMKRSTLFVPNEAYDDAFNKHNTSPNSDFKWLLYSK